MRHYVPLEMFPDEIEIPATLQDRFWYDHDRKSLVFDGPMYKLTFDRLRGLSHDFDYQRALERLFQSAVPEAPRVQQEHGLWRRIAGLFF